MQTLKSFLDLKMISPPKFAYANGVTPQTVRNWMNYGYLIDNNGVIYKQIAKTEVVL